VRRSSNSFNAVSILFFELLEVILLGQAEVKFVFELLILCVFKLRLLLLAVIFLY